MNKSKKKMAKLVEIEMEWWNAHEMNETKGEMISKTKHRIIEVHKK